MLGATACLSESIAHDLGLALSLVAFRDETNRAPLTQNGVALEGGSSFGVRLVRFHAQRILFWITCARRRQMF